MDDLRETKKKEDPYFARLEFERQQKAAGENRARMKALEVARDLVIDIALVDLKMPGISGEETLKALKKAHPWSAVFAYLPRYRVTYLSETAA